MDNTIKPFSEITPGHIINWKARYGINNLSEIEIGESKFVVKKPNRIVLDLVGQHGNKGNVSDANKVLISNCVLGGDMDDLENDGGVYAGMLTELMKLLEKKTATVKKL